jgi:hypothetical protein
MNRRPAMNDWPDFVIEEDVATGFSPLHGDLTGWETVVFELQDVDGSDFSSTAALAP